MAGAGAAPKHGRSDGREQDTCSGDIMNRYELSDFVLTLIDKANTHTPLRFQQSMIALVRDVIVFDSAWWGWSLFRGGRISIVHTNLSGLPAEFEAAVRERLLIDPFIRAGRSLKLFAKSLTVDESVSDPDFKSLGQEFNLTHMLNGHCNVHGGSFNFFMSLYREGRSQAFSETEKADFLAILRHLEQALSLSLQHDLSLRVDPHHEWALVDHHGELFLCSLGFNAALATTLTRGQKPTTRLKELVQQQRLTSRSGTVFTRRRYSDELWILSIQPRSPWMVLSLKERQIADMLCSGATARSISERLDVSVNTVRNQTSSIYRKLGIHNKVELARLATERSDRPA
jgi:DNA-binding CsgD family transcriptional regulator